MEERVTFVSGRFKLAGVLHAPDARGPRKRRPAFLVLHGFGSSKDSGGSVASAKLFADLGYAALRFDMRGCGQSEGVRGRVICLEQVEDTQSALGFLATRPEIDADRIAVMGASFGAAVAIYTAAVDPRVAACVSADGWGDGEKNFRKQHESPEAWARFTAMLAEGRRRCEQTGESIMVPRYDIVPIPPRRFAATWRPAPSWNSRSRSSRACTPSAPTTWSARSPRGRSCCSIPRTTR